MADETKQASTSAEPPPIVDLDAGQSYGSDLYTFLRPFRFKGVEHRTVSVRLPNGADVDRFIGGRSTDAAGLIALLTGLPKELLDRLYGADLDALDKVIGRHVALASAEAPDQPSPDLVDLDAGQGFGKELHTLVKPFRINGMTYREIAVRIPNGWDVEKNLSPRTGRIDPATMREHLTEKRQEVFDAMYAGDRSMVDRIVGKHSAVSRATFTS